jgi:hypothetical protein
MQDSGEKNYALKATSDCTVFSTNMNCEFAWHIRDSGCAGFYYDEGWNVKYSYLHDISVSIAELTGASIINEDSFKK